MPLTGWPRFVLVCMLSKAVRCAWCGWWGGLICCCGTITWRLAVHAGETAASCIGTHLASGSHGSTWPTALCGLGAQAKSSSCFSLAATYLCKASFSQRTAELRSDDALAVHAVRACVHA